VRLHAVIGGNGPAVLLVHGWPESWYAWRLLMPTLARNFTVIAVDQLGMGLSDKPESGYDTGSQARNLIALMDALGHQQFSIGGHDTGFTIAYAVAADFPERVDHAFLAEIPGAPGTKPSPPLFTPANINNRLWHLPFNRVETLPEQLVAGREKIFFGYEFAIQGGTLAEEVVNYYVGLLSNPESLRGSFGWYRALDMTIAQNEERKGRKLTIPVLGIGGELSYGGGVGAALEAVADDVTTLVVPGTGHWVAEEAPDQLLAALTPFLAPRTASVGAA
jgi:pimeloyl-ACP methyl ester carboxylesterase